MQPFLQVALAPQKRDKYVHFGQHLLKVCSLQLWCYYGWGSKRFRFVSDIRRKGMLCASKRSDQVPLSSPLLHDLDDTDERSLGGQR